MIFLVKILLGDSVNREIDLKNYSVRADLVIDLFKEELNDPFVEVKKDYENGIEVTDALVKKDENSLGKKHGKYITIAFSDITDKENLKKVEDVFIHYLKEMMNYLEIQEDDKVLIIGLGNMDSTPDSLGPKVVNDIVITKYLFDNPEIDVSQAYRNVSAFIPGVLASTGIVSSDMVLGIIDKTKPDFVLVIDALASSSLDRINKTIQMTDSGIHPGSGIGNNRKEISKEVLGIPVISIGVPTVIEAITLVSDTIQYMYQHLSYNKENLTRNKLVPIENRNYLNHKGELTKEEKEELLGQVGSLTEMETKRLIFEVLTPIGYNMMVTPKEIDFLIEKLVFLLSDGINKCLHKNFDI